VQDDTCRLVFGLVLFSAVRTSPGAMYMVQRPHGQYQAVAANQQRQRFANQDHHNPSFWQPPTPLRRAADARRCASDPWPRFAVSPAGGLAIPRKTVSGSASGNGARVLRVMERDEPVLGRSKSRFRRDAACPRRLRQGQKRAFAIKCRRRKLAVRVFLRPGDPR